MLSWGSVERNCNFLTIYSNLHFPDESISRFMPTESWLALPLFYCIISSYASARDGEKDRVGKKVLTNIEIYSLADYLTTSL